MGVEHKEYSLGMNSPRSKHEGLKPAIQTITDDGKITWVLQELRGKNIEVRIMLDPSTREKKEPLTKAKGSLHYRIDSKTVYTVPIQLENGFGVKNFTLPPEIDQLTNNPKRVSYLLEINKSHDPETLAEQTQKAIAEVIRLPEYVIELNSIGQTCTDDDKISLTVKDDHFNKSGERKFKVFVRSRSDDPAILNCKCKIYLNVDGQPVYSQDLDINRIDINNGVGTCKVAIPAEIAEKTKGKACYYSAEIFRKI